MSQETNITDDTSLTTCQSCGKNDPNLSPVDSGLKLALAQSGVTEIPSMVCTGCLKSLKKSASQGSQLKAKEEAVQKNRTDAWNSRLILVKQGRAFLGRQQFAEDIVSYEQYLKVITLVL